MKIPQEVSENLIFDIGMHEGEDTEFYLKKGFNVVAVEANPMLCQKTSTRLQKYIDSGQLKIINAAIADSVGFIDFYVSPSSPVWSTANLEWVRRSEQMGASFKSTKVTSITFEQIVYEFGLPYYLKIDIEGNDTLCLEGLVKLGCRPTHISIESCKTSMRDLRRELELLSHLGYNQFKIINQNQVPEQACPNPPLEGAYVNHKFKRGSSGAFGNETPGKWRTIEFVRLNYIWIYFKYFLYGNNGLIPNLHIKTKRWPTIQKLVHPGWYDTHATINRPPIDSH